MDHGRYRVALNGAAPVVVYFLSDSQRVVHRPGASSLGAIATWRAVWKELGILPSGYRGPVLKAPAWEWSDAGNYAHLIRTIALVLLDRAGTCEWDVARRETPPDPLRAANYRRAFCGRKG